MQRGPFKRSGPFVRLGGSKLLAWNFQSRSRPGCPLFLLRDVNGQSEGKAVEWSTFLQSRDESVRTELVVTDRSSNQSAEIGRTDDAGHDKH